MKADFLIGADGFAHAIPSGEPTPEKPKRNGRKRNGDNPEEIEMCLRCTKKTCCGELRCVRNSIRKERKTKK